MVGIILSQQYRFIIVHRVHISGLLELSFGVCSQQNRVQETVVSLLPDGRDSRRLNLRIALDVFQEIAYAFYTVIRV